MEDHPSRRRVLAGFGASLVFGRAAVHAAPNPRSLAGLPFYKAGVKQSKGFTQDGRTALLAFFGTTYSTYPGCNGDLVSLAGSAKALRDAGWAVEGAFLCPDLPGTDRMVWNAYIAPAKTYPLLGFLLPRQSALDLGRRYGAHYIVDRRTGNIIGHSRTAILIGPDGRRVRAFDPQNPHEIERVVPGILGQFDKPAPGQ